MPPVVTGAVVPVVELNLAGVPVKNKTGGTNFGARMQALTFLCVGLCWPCSPAASCSAR